MFRSGEFSLRDYIDMLYRRRWMILGCALVGMLAGLIPASLDEPVYSGTSTIRLRSSANLSPFEDTQENPRTAVRNLVTDTQVIESPETRAAVVERLGVDMKPFDEVSADLVPYSELIDITVLAPTAAGAAEAASAFADQYVEMVREASVTALELQASELRERVRSDTERQAVIDQALLSPSLPVPERAALQQERSNLALQIAQYATRADQLEVEVALREELAAVASRAQIDNSPVSPTPFLPGAIGLVLGFLIGLCVAVLLELLRDRLSTPSALETIDPDMTILASVPHADIDLDNPRTPVPRPVREAIRYLQTGLRVAGIDHPFSSILVSSSLPEEGKTTTAMNLAEALAEDGLRVVLVDADTRRPSIHERLGLDNEIGLSTVLAGDVDLGEAVQYVGPSLAVVTAGPQTDDASELLRSYKFEQMVRNLGEQSDLVIIDTPPVLPVADALEVSRIADAALLVVRVDRIRRRDITAAVKRFRDARVRLLGFVANDLSATSGFGEYGGYGYDYDYRPRGERESKSDGATKSKSNSDGVEDAVSAEPTAHRGERGRLVR